MLTLWFATFFLELVLYQVSSLWKWRRASVVVLCMAIAVSTIWLLGQIGVISWLLVGVLGVFRIGNLLRIITNRMHEQYLKRAVKRTGLWLFLFHGFVMLAFVLPLTFAASSFWHVVGSLQLLVVAETLGVLFKNVTKLRFQMPQVFLTDRELPTVTVAIPARNETIDLKECLQTILANDYPKLEILVLDDCSQNQTADIIRSFAHDGVRFIKGSEPPDRWLAKNQAYQKLYEEATGDLILFCGVDARFGPQAIRSMVNLMSARQKSMLSVLPVRIYSSAATVFIQPMRYWWELSLPRRLFNMPAVLSTCWIIGRQDMRALGGFGAVSHSILPERYFARELIKTDQYSFVRSSAELRVETVKNYHEQYATALRTRYPQLRHRPEWVLAASILHILFMILPYGLLIISPWWRPVNLWVLLISCLLLSVCNVMIVASTDPANSLLASFTLPVAAMVELYVMYSSMIRYEFFTVEWKDRNICIPVMHVYPQLPDLSA